MPIDAQAILRGTSAIGRSAGQSVAPSPSSVEAVPAAPQGGSTLAQSMGITPSSSAPNDPIKELISSSVGLGISGLAGVGNFLDLALGGSSVRDVLTGNNPVDQFLTPFSHVNRATGRDVLTTWGLTPPNDEEKWELSDVAGFGAEVALDPGSWLTFGANSALGKGGQVLGRAGMLDDVTRAGKNLPYTSRLTTTVGDAVNAARATGDASKLDDLAAAAAKMGYNNVDDFVAVHGAEQVGGLAGVGLPFMSPSFTVGHGAGAQRAATVLDHIFGPASYARTASRAASGAVQGAGEADPPITEFFKSIMGERAGGYAGAVAEPVAQGYDALKRRVRQGHDVSVLDQYDPVAQEVAQSSYRASTKIKPEVAAKLREIDDSYNEAFEAYASTVGDAAFEEMKRAPVNVDSASILDMSKSLAGPDLAGWAETADLRKWKSENQWLVRRLNNIRKKGGDHNNYPQWDLLKDEQLAGIPSLRSMFNEADVLQNNSDLDSRLFDLLTTPSGRGPKVSDFSDEAQQRLTDLFDGHGNGSVVRVGSPKLVRRAKDMADAGEDVSGFHTELTGMVVEAGTKQSKVMLRNPNTDAFEQRWIPNERILGQITDKETVDGMERTFVQQQFSDIMRMFGEATSASDTPLHEALQHFTGESGLKRLTPKAEAAMDGFLKKVNELKDGSYAELEKMGVPVTWLGEDSGDLISHLPRYLTKKGEQHLAKKSGNVGFHNVMQSLKGRSPEIRDLPTHLVDGDLLMNKRYRGAKAVENILADLEDDLDPGYLAKKKAAAGIVEENMDFDPQSFDADAIASKIAHAEDLAKWVGKHDRASLFGNLLISDVERYVKQASQAKAMARGLHDSLAMNAVPSGQIADGIPLSEVLTSAGFNGEFAAEHFAREYGKSVDNLVIPRDMADAVAGLKQFGNGKYFDGPLADFITKFNDFWKTTVTTPFPAFHVRNFISGQMHNFLSGGVNLTLEGLKSYVKAFGNALEMMKKLMRGGEFTDDELRLIHEMHDNGMLTLNHTSVGGGVTVDKTRYAGAPDATGIVPSLDPRLNASADAADYVSKNPSMIDGLAGGRGRTFRKGMNTVFKMGQNTGEAVEFLNRVPLYLYYRKQLGMSAETATQRVNTMHFDYSSATKFESQVAKKAFPFWSFTRKMTELMARDLMSKPGGRLAQAIRASRIATDIDHSAPEYVSENISIPLGKLPDGSNRYITGLGLMHESPLKMLSFNENQPYPEMDNLGVQLLSSTTPVIKAPLELIFGESLFQRGPDGGRDLDDMDPTIGRAISNVKELFGGDPIETASGQAKPFISKTFEHIASNAPGSRFLTTIRQMTDPRKLAGGPFPGSAMMVNLLTGARVADISPGAQDAVIRDALRRIGEDQLDLRTFERPYLSKAQVEETRKTDPEKARRQEMLQQAFKILADNAKARKKAKEAVEAN